MTITRHWMNVAVVAMIGSELRYCNTSAMWFYWIIVQVIMIARLYAMYQGSRKMLIFLVVVFVAVKSVTLVMTIISMTHISEGKFWSWIKDFCVSGSSTGLAEVFILSGTYQCDVTFEEDDVLMASMAAMLTTAWEVLILCLAVWIVVKHFREMQRPSRGWIFGDLFTALIKSHVVYFARWVQREPTSLFLLKFRTYQLCCCFLHSPDLSVSDAVSGKYACRWLLHVTDHGSPFL